MLTRIACTVALCLAFSSTPVRAAGQDSCPLPFAQVLEMENQGAVKETRLTPDQVQVQVTKGAPAADTMYILEFTGQKTVMLIVVKDGCIVAKTGVFSSDSLAEVLAPAGQPI